MKLPPASRKIIGMQRILTTTDFSMRSQRSVRRAGLLARKTGAELMLLHVVDDDQPAHLIELERNEASKLLEGQQESTAELRDIPCRFIVNTGDAFDVILHTAESTSADLIVMELTASNCCAIFSPERPWNALFAEAPARF